MCERRTTSKSCCSQARQAREIEGPMKRLVTAGLIVATSSLLLLSTPRSWADAPAWVHGAATAPLPEHDEKTDAVLLYAEDVTTVQPNGKIKTLRRRVYKILRPDGKWYGVARAYFDAE